MRKLNQLAAAVAIVMAGASVPAGAAVLGGAGEALLVPLAVWSGGTYFLRPGPDNNSYTPAVDTLIEVWIPGAVGFDAIPNNFVAINTTPTFDPTSLVDTATGSSDPDLLPPNNPQIHWFWFDQRSKELASGQLPVTPNDVVQLSVTELADGSYENVPGYMVITNQSAINGSAAKFAMFGNAWLTGAFHIVTPDPRPLPAIDLGIGIPFIGGSIPVLAMNDGVDNNPADFAGGTYPVATNTDSVKYDSGVPYSLSPLVSGFRSGRSDGTKDTAVFDVALSNRLVPTIHVIWVDHNLGANSSASPFSIADLYKPNFGAVDPNVPLQVYDTDEQTCNSRITLPDELNVIWYPPAYERAENGPWQFWNRPFAWTTQSKVLCIPRAGQGDDSALLQAGFVQYKVREYIDTNKNRAEAAMFAFSIKVDGGFVSNDAVDGNVEALVLMLETSLGHDRGTFKNAGSPPSGG